MHIKVSKFYIVLQFSAKGPIHSKPTQHIGFLSLENNITMGSIHMEPTTLVSFLRKQHFIGFHSLGTNRSTLVFFL
jgi:hypothetical protein